MLTAHFLCEDNRPCGTASLRASEDGSATDVTIDLRVPHLSPGPHGFHVHESGSLHEGCASMGAHYDPDSQLHPFHVGDLGNVASDHEGRIQATLTVRAPLQDLAGRGLVLHRDADDLGMGGTDESLHTGTAGERVACASIVR